MPLRASSHPGSPNSPSCSALAWYSCWPGLSPWGESWKRTRVARTAALTRYRYATQPTSGLVREFGAISLSCHNKMCAETNSGDASLSGHYDTPQCCTKSKWPCWLLCKPFPVGWSDTREAATWQASKMTKKMTLSTSRLWRQKTIGSIVTKFTTSNK